MAQYSEQSLIASVLRDNAVWWEICGIVKASDFAVPEHAIAFDLIGRELETKKSIDVIMLCEINPSLELSYFGGLVKNQTTTKNAVYYAKQVRANSIRRTVHNLVIEAGNAAMDSTKDIVEIITSLQTDLEGLVSDDGATVLAFDDVLRKAIAHSDEMRRLKREKKILYPTTGIPAIDRRTGGIYGPRLWAIAARPGNGKSALAQQIAINVAKQGYPVSMCSLEMGDEEHGHRALAYMLQVNNTALAQGDNGVMDAAKKAMERVNVRGLPIHLDTQTFSLGGVISRLTELHRKYKTCLGIVDHIGLIETDDKKSRNDQMGEISRALKKLCKRLNMPVFALCQLNRAMERENRRPQLSDLRDSGNIEQDIDNALFLHAKDMSQDGNREIDMGFLKHRGGRMGWFPEAFRFDGATQTIREISHVHE